MPWTVPVGELGRETRVAIGSRRPDGSSHLGVIYRQAPGGILMILHLAWHHRLRDEPCGPGYRATPIAALPPELAPTVVARCNRLTKAYPRGGPSYGFGYRAELTSEDPVTGALQHEGFSGFTCATFVLEALRDLPLVDLDAWQPAAGDDEWKDFILQTLQEHGASEAHLEAVRRDVKFVRVQPEQVAAAATFAIPPAPYTRIQERAVEIRRELEGASAI